MMISSKGRYALRVMVDMAEHQKDGFLRLNDIAERQQISRKYLESIMNLLCKNALVESSVGKAGGYRLLREPADYSVGEILRAAEGGLSPVACLDEDGRKCGGSCLCYMLPFFQGLEDQINGYVNRYTLGDLLNVKENTPACGGADKEKKESHT